MKEIQIVIFSFNRAMQLEALLSSLKDRMKSPSCVVDVLYNCSSDEMKRGYEALIKKYEGDRLVRFCKESRGCRPYSLRELAMPRNLYQLLKYPVLRHPRTDFRPLLTDILKADDSRYVMFLTDDSVFVRDFEIPCAVLEWIDADRRRRQFSLRLGESYKDAPSELLVKEGETMSWNMEDAPAMTDWSYNFSVDAHVYSKESVLYLLENYIFTAPNNLEGTICGRAAAKGFFTQARAVRTPVILSFPLNMVQSHVGNESMDIKAEEMNELYLEGYGISYPEQPNPQAFQIYPDEIAFVRGDETVRRKLKML